MAVFFGANPAIRLIFCIEHRHKRKSLLSRLGCKLKRKFNSFTQLLFFDKMQTIVRTTSDNPNFRKLIQKLDELLQIVDGKDNSCYDHFNKVENIKNVVVCYENETPIGCGGINKINEETIEIKRMFVEPSFRQKGIASKILHELEIWAKEEKYSTAILETGKKLENAIALYQKSGYVITENYGQYIGIESSVCLKKTI